MNLSVIFASDFGYRSFSTSWTPTPWSGAVIRVLGITLSYPMTKKFDARIV
jgi:hypothetical protein